MYCEFRINDRYNTRFTGQQCNQKWRNLVRDYNASEKIYIYIIYKNWTYLSDTPMVFWYLELLLLS
jgi:hypothetical protein